MPRLTAGEGEVRLWPEPWASAATVEADTIEAQLNRALAGDAVTAKQAATQQSVLSLLASARSATELGSRRHPSLRDRWRGTSLERAHYCLHGAKAAMVDVLSEQEVNALLPTAAARLATCLPPTDVRRLDIEALLVPVAAGVPPVPPLYKRAVLKRTLQLGFEASDQLHARVRSFRNLLIVVAATIFVFMAVLVIVVSFKPTAVPFCFNPPVEVTATERVAAPAGTSSADLVRGVCPSGHDPASGVLKARTPSSLDISIVAGLGMIGGALAAAVAIRNVKGTSTPYDVPLALAVLKVPTGALTAVSGILLLGGGFVPGLSQLDSQGQIIAYALVLGYAQQLVTKLIDKQAMTVLNDVPSKDATGKQPTRSAAAVIATGSAIPARVPETA